MFQSWFASWKYSFITLHFILNLSTIQGVYFQNKCIGKLPLHLHNFCECQIEKNSCFELTCKNFSISGPIEFGFTYADHISSLSFTDSFLNCSSISQLSKPLTNLKRLKILRSIVKPCSKNDQWHLKNLEELDLSNNKLTNLDGHLFNPMTNLKVLNLSGNILTNLRAGLFKNQLKLKVLDLSSNRLNHNLSPDSFYALPPNLEFLNIHENPWPCSAELAWMYNWSKSLIQKEILLDPAEIKCRYYESKHDASLLLVMEYFSKYILPSCPLAQKCECIIENIQEKVVTTLEADRHYTVFVSCSNKNLTIFPGLPEHTRTLDLTGNMLTSEAFEQLRVKEMNYTKIENLTLNFNLLESLPKNILDMNLGISFSAKNNRLTSITYDVAQFFARHTSVLEMGDNPWICSCTSQITDLFLLSKFLDQDNSFCGEGSDHRLIQKKIHTIDPEFLCPPDESDETWVIFLHFLCAVFSIFIVGILARLAYETYIYQTRGKLPWIVLWMS